MATPTPTAKPDAAAMTAIKTKTLATQAAQKGFGAGTGAVNSALNPPGGTPSASCGAGTPTGTDPAAATDPNSTMGPSTVAPGGNLSGNLAGVNPKVQDMVRSSVPAGCRAQATPHGGVGTRSKKNSAHPKGLAIDSALYCGGKQQMMGSPQLNQYISNLNQNGARGLAAYRQGFVHADLGSPHQRRWSGDGADAAYTNAAAGGQDPGPGAAQQAGQSGGGGGGDPCGGGGGGGCQPVQSSAAQNAASLAGNQGFDVSSIASMAAGLMSGGSPLSSLMGMAQQAIGGALGSIPGLSDAIALGTQALSDPAGAISSIASKAFGNMGSGIMPSMVGNMATSLMSSSGMDQGFLASSITGTASQIFAKQSPPKLDKFISIFNAAHSAQDFASSLQETIGNTMNNVFGNAGELFADLERNNWANNPDYTLENNPYITLNGPSIGEVSGAVSATIDRSQFIGDPSIVLKNLIENNKSFNVFSSMFYNWDAYVTRGFGTLTNNVIELGTDLKGLGKLADLNDILRIGTPGQIAQQIILHGAGGYAGLLTFLVDSSLQFADLSSKSNDDLVYEYLASVNDPDVIAYVKEVLGMDVELNLTSLGDLLDAEIILPRSYEYNYFENLNHIAVFLGMCINAGGRITTFGELGALVESFEVPFDSTALEGEPAIYDYDELTKFALEYAPVGFFTSDGSLSVADFIGTAAGYIHDRTAPRIAELQTDLYENTTYFDDYATLITLLTDAANGSFYVPAVPAVPMVSPAVPAYVSVPNTAGYTFGDYSTLDAAILAIIDAVEEELDLIRTNIASDDENAFKLLELDTLHNESSMQLAREHKLRKTYGMQLGSPKKHDQFISDGITRALPLTGEVNTEDDINVFVDGAWLSPNNYSISANGRTLTLDTAPAAMKPIAVSYKTTAFNGIANKMQVWDFAANLENIALDTGYGRAADFLRRVTTNDKHGQRITATLMNARNKARTDTAGLAFPDFEIVNGTSPSYINYVDWTGIWTTEPDRAGEIYVQHSQDVSGIYEYLLSEIVTNKASMQDDVESLANNIARQLIFFNNGNLAVSELFINYYNDNSSGEINREDRSDLFLGYSNDLPTDGYILGPYKEIISELCNQENLQNTVFTDKLSDDTKNYLASMGLEMRVMISIVQRIMSVTISRYFGLSEGNFRSVFGMQSVSRAVIANIANNT